VIGTIVNRAVSPYAGKLIVDAKQDLIAIFKLIFSACSHEG
jgi:hypothetical protein